MLSFFFCFIHQPPLFLLFFLFLLFLILKSSCFFAFYLTKCHTPLHCGSYFGNLRSKQKLKKRSSAKALNVTPTLTLIFGTESEHRLCAVNAPPHTGSFKALLDNSLIRAFNSAATNEMPPLPI